MSNDLHKLLLQLDAKLAEKLMEDLQNDDVRSPQLYKAIDGYLNRHKITVSSVEPSKEAIEVFSGAVANFDNYRRAQRANEDY